MLIYLTSLAMALVRSIQKPSNSSTWVSGAPSGGLLILITYGSFCNIHRDNTGENDNTLFVRYTRVASTFFQPCFSLAPLFHCENTVFKCVCSTHVTSTYQNGGHDARPVDVITLVVPHQTWRLHVQPAVPLTPVPDLPVQSKRSNRSNGIAYSNYQLIRTTCMSHD